MSTLDFLVIFSIAPLCVFLFAFVMLYATRHQREESRRHRRLRERAAE
ncbi:hypothetical protein [Youhaiella tibetensis]|nr:hypothetical protein [Youhaiella tibetensis]